MRRRSEVAALRWADVELGAARRPAKADSVGARVLGVPALEARLTWRFAGALLAQTAAMAAIMATLLRLFAPA